MSFALLFLHLAAAFSWWNVQTTGADSNLRGVSVVADFTDEAKTVIWVSGSNGAILRSVDSGKHWKRVHVPNGDSLDFRGVHAVNGNTAYVMSSGEGTKSRIYKTVDAGKTWELQYTDQRKPFFLDAIACIDDTHCYALSDPLDGKFLVMHTDDGAHWSELPRDHMPAALPNEGAFAASNSSLVVDDTGGVYFATGGPAARIFHSADRGKTWSVSNTPILSGKSSTGIFSMVIRGQELIVVGGDYQDPARADKNAAVSHDQGKTWQLAVAPPGGYRSAVVEYAAGYVTVGPDGAEISSDGLRWQHTDSVNLNAICFDSGQGWAVGPNGIVAHFIDHNQYEIQNFESSPGLQAARWLRDPPL